MANSFRTVAIFESDTFNLSEPKSYFINPCCFGHDLARWLRRRLRKNGAACQPQSIGQEDFGWYLVFRVADEDYCLVIGNRGGEDWFVAVERDCGFWASILGRRKHNIGMRGVMALHDVLKNAGEIRNLAWHWMRDFESGDFEKAAASPDA